MLFECGDAWLKIFDKMFCATGCMLELALPSASAIAIGDGRGGRTEGLPLCDGCGFAAGAAVGAEAGMRTLSSDFAGGHIEIRANKEHLSKVGEINLKHVAHSMQIMLSSTASSWPFNVQFTQIS